MVLVSEVGATWSLRPKSLDQDYDESEAYSPIKNVKGSRWFSPEREKNKQTNKQTNRHTEHSFFTIMYKVSHIF